LPLQRDLEKAHPDHLQQRIHHQQAEDQQRRPQKRVGLDLLTIAATKRLVPRVRYFAAPRILFHSAAASSSACLADFLPCTTFCTSVVMILFIWTALGI